MTVEAAERPARGRKPRFSRRRDQVLRTAARIFSDLGFRQATLEDVAGALNMTRPALYYYAASKDDLLSECGQIALAGLQAALREANGRDLGLEQLTSFFAGYVEVICDDFGRCLVLTDPRELSETRLAGRVVIQREFNRAVEAMIRRGMADESIAPCDAVDVRRALFAAFNGVPRWYKPESGRTPRDVARGLMGVFVQGLKPRAG